jgi:DNA-binding response OmpR family regulator
MGARILVVENDRALGTTLRDTLAIEGFDVTWVINGDSALKTQRVFGPDLIILDLTLPGRSGCDLFEPLQQGGRTPIIILTARGQRADKLLGLSVVADDYLTKPLDLEELLARVQAVLRRSRPAIARLTLGRVSIDFRTRVARSGKSTLHLTDREFALLEYLARRRQRVVYRDELLRGVWGYADIPATRSVDHAIARLRKKVEADPSHPRFIHTVHGDGYRLNAPPGAR